MGKCELQLTEVISNEIESLGVVCNFIVEAGQIKSIQDVIFLDFAEVFVAFGRQKP